MKKYFFIILALIIAVAGYFYIAAVGKEYTYVRNDFTTASAVKDVFLADDSHGSVEILDWNTSDEALTIRVKSGSPGRTYVEIIAEDTRSLAVFYVHKNGVITNMRFFGDSTGSSEVIFCILLYVLLLSVYFIVKHIEQIKKSLYSYDNVLSLGLIIFTFFLAYTQGKAVFYKDGISGAFSQAVSSSQGFILVTFPLVFITTVFVTISNIQLIRKEGRNWKNLLGLFLGLALGIGSLLPVIIGEWLQHYSHVIDVHNERGFGRFFEMFIENSISSVVTYLECILLGTIFTGIKAARHIPAFDKDYIIIHGCQIRKDGTLTKLLQSRVDRAVEFAKMQKDKSGKDIIFVPSGGKGSDEVISEGEAMKRYLLENGISEDKILKEDASTSTEENIRFAKEMMREHFGSSDYKAAFATTNYHVFRTGMLAEQNGLKAEGIGSKTKAYFWINAFVREFIATIVEKKKTHLKVVGVIFLINIISVVLYYISEAVLF
ncbi:MAG: YdcF family protein [Clostridiales bacterium]|nr:YdcF family protein [Clostridiales bacterium]